MKKIKHIELNIGKACNNKCRFCMSLKPTKQDLKFVTLDILKEKILGYRLKGYNSIGFLGGDISIHPNIVEIISFCKKQNFTNINVITNGVKFNDLEFAKNVILAGLTRVNFSIHSHISKVEDYLTGIKGGLEKKLKAIDNFRFFYNRGLLRDNLSINIVLNLKNLKTIVETVLYFYKVKKINDIRINFIWLSDEAKENWEDLKISYTEFLPYLKKLIFISLKYKIRITFDAVPPCIFHKVDNKNYESLIQRFLGEGLDIITDIEHINKGEKFNWKQRKKDNLKLQFDDCKVCNYFYSCEGIWKNYGKIFGSKEFTPIIRKDNDNGNKSKLDLTIFDEKIKEFYKDDKDFLEKYNYINDLIDNLK